MRLRDLTFDHDPPPFSQGTIVSVSSAGGDGIEIVNARGVTLISNPVAIDPASDLRFLPVHLTSVASVAVLGLVLQDARVGLRAGVLIDGESPQAGGFDLKWLSPALASGVPAVAPGGYQ